MQMSPPLHHGLGHAWVELGDGQGLERLVGSSVPLDIGSPGSGIGIGVRRGMWRGLELPECVAMPSWRGVSATNSR